MKWCRSQNAGVLFILKEAYEPSARWGNVAAVPVAKEQSEKSRSCSLPAEHWKLLISWSAYVSGLHAPKLVKEMNKDEIVVKISKERILQRLVATDTFYESERERYDTVMVTKRSLTENGIESTRCWFARSSRLLKVLIRSNFVSSSLSSDPLKFWFEESEAKNEFCSVQWFEIIDETILTVDKLDTALKCLRLQWRKLPVRTVFIHEVKSMD